MELRKEKGNIFNFIIAHKKNCLKISKKYYTIVFMKVISKKEQWFFLSKRKAYETKENWPFGRTFLKSQKNRVNKIIMTELKLAY